MSRNLLALILTASILVSCGQKKEFIDGAFEGLQLQTSLHEKSWGLGKADDWSVDLTRGTLTFDFSDGKTATTDIQVIGTYNSNDSTFLWGWDHPSVRNNLAKHAVLAKEWGEKNNDDNFTTLKLSCSENEV